MKRNVIQKYQRLEQIMNQYAEEIEALAIKQIEIYKKVVTEYNLHNEWEHRQVTVYDFLKVGENGEVELWERGRCGDSDSWNYSINLDEFVIKGDFERYEQRLRTIFKSKAEAAAKAKEVEKQKKRQQLQADLERITKQLETMS